MPRQPESPSPSTVGFALNRRRFVIGAAAFGGAVLLNACGDDDDDSGVATDDTAGGTESTETAEGSGDLGEITLGSNQSDEVPKNALAAAIATTGLNVAVNTVDHNTFQENFNTYIQQPDDTMTWFAGYRTRAFARRGVVGDISDVWENLDGMSEGFRNASTASDGNQYFVPFTFYAWGVHYRKSLFEENGYEIPETWDDFMALCEQMESDGITPLCAANDGGWPQMGMFDMLNLRINGYDFHVSLLGGNEDWTDDRVKEVFTTWESILPFYQPDVAGRTWQDAANALGDKSAGMFLIGNFVNQNFDADTQADIIEDVDFFLFPEINPEHERNAIEAPIDGFMMASEPANEEGAKALLTALGGTDTINAYLEIDPSVVAANENADTSAYNALQQKATELINESTYVAQFLDRDTDPSFAADVVGVAIADFLADPGSIDTILSTVEEQKATYTFE
ncbi:MAG: ABC transporter substrate-binding protein [Actinomycetota bacterium]|nr:ABC transporter substrate-binding protein [Actinomycetota bacterium]